MSRYDGKAWTTFTSADGLASDQIICALRDREGDLWFAAYGGGMSRYHGQHLTTFSTRDGLVHNLVKVFMEDHEGNLWFGTTHGVSRYDGKKWTTFTTKNGLAGDYIMSSLADSQGQVWFGATAGGLSRYDGKKWTIFTAQDGLADNLVVSIAEDREGILWFGTGDGVSRYDRRRSNPLTVEDSLAIETVTAIAEDSKGNLWFGLSGLSQNGVRRYDGKEWTAFTTEDGLVRNIVGAIAEDGEGNLWFGADGNEGVSRYDGKQFVKFTTREGLAHNDIRSIMADRRGHLWFGHWGGGVSLYDGTVFQRLQKPEGLPNELVQKIVQTRNGDIWIASEGGATRYRPAKFPPTVPLVEVVADRSYGSVAEIDLPSTQNYLSFAFEGASLRTRPERMVYVYRLLGRDDTWRQVNEGKVEYADLPIGEYTFEVKAVDTDLNYSEPAQVRVTVYPPYERLGLISALAIALGLAGWQTTRVVRRDRTLRHTNEALSGANKELFSLNRELQEKGEDLEKTNEDLEKARGAAEAANHAKSLFLANMSHEIRTPMNAILGYAQILHRSPDLGGPHRRAVETIHRSGDHLLNLINDVLDISKIEAGRMALSPDDFDLREMLENLGTMFELQCREKGLGWRLEGIGPERLPVHGDEAKLRQVLINLLGNAVKFTKEGEVALRLVRLPEDRYGFEVQDTGPGMTAQEQEQIFQPFQQGEAGMRQGGTGLGLTISQRQLGLMGSALKVDSEVGKGSRFSFAVELPPAQGALRTEGPRTWGQVKGLAAGFSVKALIADDVAENREILSGMLGELGVEVETVENGQQALERMEASLPDIVFLDIRMPVLDGLAAVRLIQENALWAQLKVVAVSASVLEHERQEFLEAGFDDFIDKPFRFERVCECLAHHLGVEFEYGEPEAAEAPDDWGEVALPSALVDRLKKAAEFYNVTQIEGHLREMEGLGEGPKKLASHLRSLRLRHDMEGIVEVLAAVDRG